MPFLHLTTLPALPPATREALAGALTDRLASVLGKRHAVSAVLIDSPENAGWFIAGRPVAATLCATQAVLYITAGTNTAEQKAAFIAALDAVLDTAGVRRPEASYCVIQEVVASDWGYGGLTQAVRAAQRQAGTA